MHDRQIEISSIFWTDIDSRDRLLHFFASHRDQIHSLKIPLPLSANVHTWFSNAGRLDSIMTDPWMVRVIDIVGALHGLPIASEPFTFALCDPYCNWNDGVFGVNGDRGQLTVKRYSNGDIADLAIDFKATIAGISALIYGTQAIGDLVHQQWITGITPETCERLEKCFTPCLIYNPFKF
jgi:predicted acetyltransferase